MRVGGFDTPLQDLMAMKAIGLNVIGLSDFHADSLAANDHGPLRFRDQKDYAEASRRLSDKDFLVVPWEEPSVAFGGHYNIMWPKNVFWSKPERSAAAGAPLRGSAVTPLPFKENDPTYGKVYHTGNAETVQRLLDAEGGYWYHAHPRTKSTAGFPDATWGTKYLKSDRYLGVAFKPGHGPGQLRGDDVRVALLRRRRHDEQHERRHRASARSSSSPTSTRTGRAPRTTCTPTSRSTT